MYNPLNEVLKFLYFKAVFISPTADNIIGFKAQLSQKKMRKS